MLNLVSKTKLMVKAGYDCVLELLKSGINPPVSCCVLANRFEEWKADNTTQKAYTMCNYNGVLYLCIEDVKRNNSNLPNVTFNKYIPYPMPISDNIYPYMMNMKVEKDMMIINNMDRIYKALDDIDKLTDDPTSQPLKFLYMPDITV